MKVLASLVLLSTTSLFSLAALAQGTPPVPQVQSSILTSGGSLAMGQRIPVQNFKTEDYVIQMVTLKWAPASASAGQHFVEHRWLQDGNLVSDNKRMINFNTTPMTLSSRRAAAALGAGHYEVQTLMDGNVIGNNQFDIAN